MISITFNQPTNKGFLPDRVSKTWLQNLFLFSMDIGFDYFGEWKARDNLVITILDEAGAGPPTIGRLTIEVKYSGNLMAHPPVTVRATPTSAPLLGNFGPSPITILSMTAADATNDDQVYSNDDFITIIFSGDTDKGQPARNPIVSQFELEAMFEFSQNIGTSFEGLWINFRTLRITIKDVTGADPPVLDQLRARVRPCRTYDMFSKRCIEDFEYCAHCDCCLGDLRNFPRTSAPTAIVGPLLTGDFGPCSFGILNITAFDALNYDSTLDDGDAIMIYFTEATDKACGSLYQAASCHDGKVLTKAQVDNLVTFSKFVAANYSAVWHSPSQLEIKLLDVSGSEARIGELFVEVRPEATGDGALPGLRNVPPVCGPTLIQSAPILGNWGLAPPFIDAFTAQRGGNSSDSVYGNGDELIIKVCAGGRGSRGEGGCNPTNMFNLRPREVVGKQMVERMFAFSQALGDDFVGQWDDAFSFRITVVDATNAFPPAVYNLTVQVKAAATLAPCALLYISAKQSSHVCSGYLLFIISTSCRAGSHIVICHAHPTSNPAIQADRPTTGTLRMPGI